MKKERTLNAMRKKIQGKGMSHETSFDSKTRNPTSCFLFHEKNNHRQAFFDKKIGQNTKGWIV